MVTTFEYENDLLIMDEDVDDNEENDGDANDDDFSIDEEEDE